MRPIAGASRHDVRRGQAERERALKPAVRRFLKEINAAIPTEALKQAAASRFTGARTVDEAMGAQILQHAQTRMDAVIRSWQRPLEELLIQPTHGVRKAAWDELPLKLLRVLARAQTRKLIQNLTAQQLETLRAQLAALMRHGATPEILAAIADTTGLTAKQSAAIRATYESVLAQSGPGAAIRAATAQRDRLLDYRATLISRTESTRYLGAVVHARGQQMGGDTVKAWVSARDADVDAGDPSGPCAVADNGQWYPMQEPFANGLMQPPAHPGCRCLIEIQQLDQEAAA